MKGKGLMEVFLALVVCHGLFGAASGSGTRSLTTVGGKVSLPDRMRYAQPMNSIV